jgi:flagellar basal body-associated protein FliL
VVTYIVRFKQLRPLPAKTAERKTQMRSLLIIVFITIFALSLLLIPAYSVSVLPLPTVDPMSTASRPKTAAEWRI